MGFKINFLFVDYAIRSLARRGGKNIFIFFILTLLVVLLSSVLMISSAIKMELNATLKNLPEITVQRFIAGKQSNIPLLRADRFLEIEGVSSATPRVWGYYYFAAAGVNFSVVGIDAFDEQYSPTMAKLAKNFDIKALEKGNAMVIGEGVRDIFKQNYYTDFYNFLTPDGKWKEVKIAGVFHSSLALEANDLIVLPKKLAYDIFGMSQNEATDIVVRVENASEIATIARKITEMYPDVRALSKDDIRVSYQNIFDYKSGFFLALFSVCAFAFFIIVYDKASGLSSEERREIGVLKAVGWSSDDVLKEKFYEGFILSLGAYLAGIAVSIFYVYTLQAPLLRNIFMGYSELKPPFLLPFSLDFELLFSLFLLSVPIYIAATLIPSWRASTLDADEVMR